MASDMVVALARTTAERRALFGHNANGPRGSVPQLMRHPERTYSPGQMVQTAKLSLTQVRHAHAVVGLQIGGEWGLRHGLNATGLAVGCAAVRARLAGEPLGLTGPDLVRLTLERAASACQAIEVLTDLITRHGQSSDEEIAGNAFLVADQREAFVVEAVGHHWAEAQIAAVRAVTSVCLLRQDWDRISRGLSDLAITQGWWPADGCKLDFAGSLAVAGSDHGRAMRRWGQATMFLEQHSGELTLTHLRQLLRDQAEAVCPVSGEADGDQDTIASLIADLGRESEDVALAWFAFGHPGLSLYLPVFPCAESPDIFGSEPGLGSRLWRLLTQLRTDVRRESRLRSAIRAALADLQAWLEEHAFEVRDEARLLSQEQRARFVGSFARAAAERVEDRLRSLRVGVETRKERATVAVAAPGVF